MYELRIYVYLVIQLTVSKAVRNFRIWFIAAAMLIGDIMHSISVRLLFVLCKLCTVLYV